MVTPTRLLTSGSGWSIRPRPISVLLMTPVLLQQHHPGIGAGEQVGPHRQDNNGEHQTRPAFGHDGEQPGDRIADDDRDQR